MTETRQERRQRLAVSPLIAEAPPLEPWQADRIATIWRANPKPSTHQTVRAA